MIVTGNWEDLSSLVPSGLTPYYFTVQGGNLYLAVFDDVKLGGGNDVILPFTPLKK